MGAKAWGDLSLVDGCFLSVRCQSGIMIRADRAVGVLGWRATPASSRGGSGGYLSHQTTMHHSPSEKSSNHSSPSLSCANGITLGQAAMSMAEEGKGVGKTVGDGDDKVEIRLLNNRTSDSGIE